MSVVMLHHAVLGPLGPTDFEIEAGVHAIVGRPGDGSLALVELLAGSRRPRSGRVLVNGANPNASPAVRRSIGSLLPSEQLPPGRAVADALRHLLRARGGPEPNHALAAMELEHWASRPTASLTSAERRSVVLAAVLALRAPTALVLYEPLADVAGVPRLLVLARLQALACQGACVISVTASLEDASAIAGRLWLLRKGQFDPCPPDPEAMLPGTPPCWRVRSERCRELAALLLNRPDIATVEYDAVRSPHELLVSTRDPRDTALTLLEVARSASVRVESVRVWVPSLDEIQAARTGALRGAYERAYHASRAEALSPGQGS